MCNAPILCIISRSKKRPFHTTSTHFSINLTPGLQKNQKSHNSQITED